MNRHWFQNLKKENKSSKLFHFRGCVYTKNNRNELIHYEFSSGPALRFEFKISPYPRLSLSLGLIFFKAYLTLPFFKFNIKESLNSGFCFYENALVWSWMKKEWECGARGGQWYKSFYFHIDDFVLGKSERLENEIAAVDDIYFKLGDKEFKINKIKWEKNRSFRRHIPYTLFHKTWYSLNIKIDKPPMHSGKGENSWDCGDDGTYGLSCAWKHAPPTWKYDDVKFAAEIATSIYVEGVLKDAKRYGGSSSATGINSKDVYEYIGLKPKVNEGANNEPDTPNIA